MVRGRTTAAALLRMICAAALLFVGFAHQVPAAIDAGGNPIVLSLPDGSIPILCTTERDNSAPGHDHGVLFKPGCEACRLAASVILAGPGDDTWLNIRRASLANPLGEGAAQFGARQHHRANSRAPPVALRAS